MKSLFTVVAVLVTVDENQPKPLVSAASGSFCRSSSLGKPSSFFGMGVLPKPAYLPPSLGGRSSGRAALAAPRLSKYLASTLALPPAPPPGLCDRLAPAVPLSGVDDLEPTPPPLAAEAEVGAGVVLRSPGTYSRPSTLALSRSFHSSPTPPLYRSAIVASSHVRPRIWVSSCSSKKRFQLSLPPSRIRSISVCLKASMEMDRTNEMCTPSPRCTPAQLRQMKMPNLGDAHCGEGALQSQQRLFPDSFWMARSCLCVRGHVCVSQAGEAGVRERRGDQLAVSSTTVPHGCAGVPWTASPGRPPTWPWKP